MKTFRVIALIIYSIVLSSGCIPGKESPTTTTAPVSTVTETLTPTLTPSSTSSPTPTPTATLTPTPTPTVTSTPTPTPTPLPALPMAGIALEPISASNVDRLEKFDTWGSSPWVETALSPEGQLLAIGTRNGIQIYAIPSLELITSLDTSNAYHSVVFNPDGELLAAGEAFAGVIRVWQVSDFTLRTTFQVERSLSGVSVAFSPDGYTLAASGKRIYLWDIRTNVLIHTLQIPQFMIYPDETDALNFSPDGKMLASGHIGRALVWDVSKGALLTTLPLTMPEMLYQKGTENCYDVAFTLDNKALICGANKLYIWDTADWSRLKLSYYGGAGVSLINSVRMGSAGLIAFAGSKGDLREGQGFASVWRVDDEEPQLVVNTDDRWSSVELTPGEQTLITTSRDNIIRLWSVNNGKILNELDLKLAKYKEIQSSDDGQWLGYILRDNLNQVLIRSLKEGDILYAINPWTEESKDRYWSLSPDGSLLSTSESGIVYIWDVKSGTLWRSLEGLPTKGMREVIRTSAIAINPDNSVIAAANGVGQVGFWTLPEGKLVDVVREHDMGIKEIYFSPDGTQLISLGHDDTVCSWQAHDAQLQWKKENIHSPYCASFHPDGRTFLLYQSNRNLERRAADTGVLLDTWEPLGVTLVGPIYTLDGSVVITNVQSDDQYAMILRDARNSRVLRRIFTGPTFPPYLGANGTLLFFHTLNAVQIWGIRP